MSDKKSRYCLECGRYISKPPGPPKPLPRGVELFNCVVFLLIAIFYLVVCSTIWWETHWWMTPVITGFIIGILVYTRKVYKRKDHKDAEAG